MRDPQPPRRQFEPNWSSFSFANWVPSDFCAVVHNTITSAKFTYSSGLPFLTWKSSWFSTYSFTFKFSPSFLSTCRVIINYKSILVFRCMVNISKLCNTFQGHFYDCEMIDSCDAKTPRRSNHLHKYMHGFNWMYIWIVVNTCTSASKNKQRIGWI